MRHFFATRHLFSIAPLLASPIIFIAVCIYVCLYISVIFYILSSYINAVLLIDKVTWF